MLNLAKSTTPDRTPGRSQPSVVSLHMAEALIGQTVHLRAVGKISHGVVAGVFAEARMPKLVVNGRRYSLSQILTVMPTSLN